MNWKEIKEKYPKGYEKYALWHNYNNTRRIIREREYDDRDLYDFFDKQDIYITLSTYYDDENSRTWTYYISSQIETSGDPEKTRTEAEEQAFLRAFEILETKLR